MRMLAMRALRGGEPGAQGPGGSLGRALDAPLVGGAGAIDRGDR